MPAPQFTLQLQSEYQRLFDTCVIQPDKYPEVDKLTNTIAANQNRYATVGNQLNIPWYFIGIVHTMEGSGNFTKHLHNGDPLSARTVNVPKGRPITGTPPFKWEDSAADALIYEKLNQWTEWGIPGMFVQAGRI